MHGVWLLVAWARARARWLHGDVLWPQQGQPAAHQCHHRDNERLQKAQARMSMKPAGADGAQASVVGMAFCAAGKKVMVPAMMMMATWLLPLHLRLHRLDWTESCRTWLQRNQIVIQYHDLLRSVRQDPSRAPYPRQCCPRRGRGR